jgi:hypothetical protein
MMSRIERPLSEAERSDLAERLACARTESAAALIKTGGVSAGICGVLAFLTVLASDAPVGLIVLFWLVMTVLFTAWIGWPWRRLMRSQVPVLDGALRANHAVETRIRAARVVEFEEVEDEGACYAFEIEPGTCVFIVGQEFYEDDDFPNTDFSMVDLLGESGIPATTLLTKAGSKLQPERVVPAAVKNAVELPKNLYSG